MKNPNLDSTIRKLVLRVGLPLIVLSLACLISLASFAAARSLSLSNLGDEPLTGPQAGIELTQVVNELGTPLAFNPNLPQSAPELTPWDGAGRVTILLLGLDYRDWETGTGLARSDTMIMLTLDPLTHSAGILSIPRDMWVSIPGFKHGKINTAYYLGDAYKLPGGGPGLAVKTVEEFLGVPVNYYAQIDFGAFVRFIDELGGVKVNVPDKITIDLLGSGSKTKKTLQPGLQVLPGEWALAYARARNTGGGDFDRAGRQQQVIMGIRDRILNLDMLPTLVQKAPALYAELANGIHTNLSLDEAIQLAALAKDVPSESIQQGVLGTDYVIFGQSPDQLSILIPIPDKIHALRDQIFATTGSLGPESPGDAQTQMKAESASVAVLNGSATAGLEGSTSDFLKSQGVSVVQTTASADRTSMTTIIDHTGSPYVLKYLVELMKISADRINIEFDPTSAVDVELILGDDWANQNPMP